MWASKLTTVSFIFNDPGPWSEQKDVKGLKRAKERRRTKFKDEILFTGGRYENQSHKYICR